MIPAGTDRLARACRWAAGVLVCAGVVCLPDVALATCGDYLAMPDHGSSHVSQRPTHDAPKPGVPCRGPNCRRSDAPATPTAPFSLERTTDQWACAFSSVGARPRTSQPRELESGVHRTDGYPQSIERPPR